MLQLHVQSMPTIARNSLYNLLDYLTCINILKVELLFISLSSIVLTILLVFPKRKQLVASRLNRIIIGLIAFTSGIGVIVIGFIICESLLGGALRESMCETSTYEHLRSEDGKYLAEVVEVDCGAVSSFHRRITLTRLPFKAYPFTVLYFKGTPKLSLEWQGRKLLIRGDRSIDSMAHKPPEHILFGGVFAHYATQ